MLVSGNGGFDNDTQEFESSSSIKFRLGLGFTLLFLIVVIFMTAGSSVDEKPNEDNEGKENLRLSRYKSNKPKRNTEQWKDYCTLKKKLEKVIDPSCFCSCEENSFWFNPPKNGNLNYDWEFISEVYSEGGSKHFRNKNTGEIVRFDKKHKENGVDHYHRYNFEIKELIDKRKFKNENLYLDICGNVLKHNLNEKNHILVLENSNEYKIKNEELCNE